MLGRSQQQEAMPIEAVALLLLRCRCRPCSNQTLTPTDTDDGRSADACRLRLVASVLLDPLPTTTSARSSGSLL